MQDRDDSDVFEGCACLTLCKWRERTIASEDALQHQTFFVMTEKAQRVLEEVAGQRYY